MKPSGAGCSTIVYVPACSAVYAKACPAPPNRDYTPFLKGGALKGARIGIPRANYYDEITLPGDKEPRGGLNAAQAKAMAEAIDIMRKQGATVIDADIPSVVDQDPDRNFLLWGGACGVAAGTLFLI